MKLSEAIRVGADLVSDGFKVTLTLPGEDGNNTDKPCGCAIGTAIYAAGGRKVGAYQRFKMLAAFFPVAFRLPLCPVCSGTGPLFGDDPKKSPGGAIECLYENHGWSRKAIAEWVEVIEKSIEPHPPCAEVDQVPLGNAAGDAASVSAPADPVHVS